MYFRSIAFGGGGVRGGLHVGAVTALEKIRGNLTFPNGVYGCSIGSIVATAVAFGMNSVQIRNIYDKYLHLSSFVPTFRITSIQNLMEKKGLFSMEKLETTVVDMFQSEGIDLKGKRCTDANQSLYIVASNLTSGRATLLTGDVPVLDAIKCSCCLPFLFEPQVLYNHLYVDGSIKAHYIHKLVPRDCLVFHIDQSHKPLFVQDMSKTSFLGYVSHLYNISRTDSITPNTIWLRNETIQILQEVKQEEKQLLFDQGYSQTLAFFTNTSSEKLQ
jgi:hypothetical protein